MGVCHYSCTCVYVYVTWRDAFKCGGRRASVIQLECMCLRIRDMAWRIQARRPTSERVHVNESYHIRMRRVTYEWVMSHTNESWHIWISHLTSDRVHVNESCHIWMRRVTYEWVMSHMHESCHVWMSHVSYEWVMSHMNESCLIWMSHVSYECVMSHIKEHLAIFRSRRPSVSWIFAPKTFCLTNQLFGLGATNSFGLGAPSF